MNISPLDIRKHEFKKSFRGYDPDEVLAFLDLISIEFESMIRENSQVKERASNFDSQLKKYRDIESTLRETLLSAQRAREETINTAKKHAEVIIREAEVKASSIIEEGRNDLSLLRNTFTELRVQKESYLIKLKALINAQLDILENLDFNEEKILNRIDSEAKNEEKNIGIMGSETDDADEESVTDDENIDGQQ